MSRRPGADANRDLSPTGSAVPVAPTMTMRRMWPVFIATPMVLSGVQVLLPALPAMKAALGLTEAQLGLVTSLYLLPSVLLALPAGILADRLGRRALLSWSLAVFGVGGVILTLYPNSFALILGVRFIQGAAFAATLSVTITILGDAFEGVREVTAQSYRALAMKIGDGALPIIGGAVAAISWFAPFATQIAAIPLALVVWWGLADLPDERRRSFSRSDRGALLVLFKQWSVIVLQVHGFLRFFMKFAFLAYSPLLLSAMDASAGGIGLALGVAAWSAAAVSPVTGRLAALLSPSKLVAISLALIGGSFLVLATTSEFGVAIAAAVVYGLADGVYGIVQTSFTTQAVGPDLRALFVGASGGIRNFGKFAAPTVIGLLAVVMPVQTVFVALGFVAIALVSTALPLRHLESAAASRRS